MHIFFKIKGYYRFFYLIILFSSFGYSQVGINTTNPDASSILDISSSDKGLLIPRVVLNSSSDTSTITTPATSLMVYNTGSAGLLEGFYYWDGNGWQALKTSLPDVWLLEGNTVVDTSHAVGTKNQMPLLFKTNDSLVANFHPSGGISIGLSAYAAPQNGLAIGRSAVASASNNLAIGVGSYSSGVNTFAMGLGSSSSGSNTFAVGTYAVASGEFGASIGTNAEATGKNAVAFGHLAKAEGDETVAIGGGAKANFLSAVALGPYSEATAVKSFALGPNTTASAENSFALGIGAVADVENTVIIGEVQTGATGVTPVNVGIGTKNPKGRLDVNGNFKMGEKGSVLKGIGGFSRTITTSTSIPANSTVTVTFAIPADNRPSSTNAVIHHTLAPATNDNIAIAWAKLNTTSNIRVKFRNDSGSPININGATINFSIIEF